MKKKSGSRIGRLLKNVFRVRSWSDFDRVKQGLYFISDAFQTYFVPQPKTKQESFESAIKRLKVTEQELLVQQKSLFRLFVILLIAASALFLYVLYNLFYARYAALILNVTVLMLALVLAFRYHFWYFQIQRRRLGCTLKDWFWQGLMGISNDE